MPATTFKVQKTLYLPHALGMCTRELWTGQNFPQGKAMDSERQGAGHIPKEQSQVHPVIYPTAGERDFGISAQQDFSFAREMVSVLPHISFPK